MELSLERPRTIWVIEDSVTDAERVRRLFAAEHRVEIIHDAAVALERLSSGAQPDLLLLDWIMPEISGIEICRYVRSATGTLAQVPILLLTAQHGTREIVQAFESGANDYVSKPFVDEELKARVSALLNARRLVERAEQAEQDVRRLLTTAPDPTVTINVQGKITFVNDEGLRAFKLPKEEILNKSFDCLVPGLSLKNIYIGSGESLLPLPDVAIGEKLFSPSIRFLESDNAASTTVALRDVTARRQADTRRLDFYSVIAHDLRTPITSVMLRLELALKGRHGILPAGHLSDIQKTQKNLRSLVGMINDFLELARFEGVGYKIDRSPVDLAELIHSTMDDFVPLLEKNEQNWKHFGPESQTFVLGDRQRLVQVLSNLIGNAIKFSSSAGTISTTLSVNKDYVEVSIQDTGRGIANHELPSLFDRFTRAHEASMETSGTGLGLMIVREIVEAHSGVIGVESELGVGSRFWFRLPRYSMPGY